MRATDPTSDIALLLARRRPDHGFPEIVSGDYRPDATAWAILCLDAYPVHGEVAAAARARLRSSQLPDGGIPLSIDHPQAFWPTFPAALALAGDPASKEAHDKAIRFVLSVVNVMQDEQGSSVGEEGRTPGWPWISQTHTWVEPTAMAVSALTRAGHAEHDRCLSGIKLLIDRQLPAGGWNYGNTKVFEQYLNPMPAPTGMALWALSGQVDRARVAASLQYLREQLTGLVTPLSLGWALIGLSAWNVAFDNGRELAADCLSRQHRYGTYNTSHLAVLLYAMAVMRRPVPEDV